MSYVKHNILVSGSTGFVGYYLVQVLSNQINFSVTASARRSVGFSGVSLFRISDIGADTDWSAALAAQDVVIHTAALAHVMKNGEGTPLEYRKINVDGALNLARQAAAAGAKRFIFISSIGVNGIVNKRPFSESDVPNPAGPYAQSKLEAEQELWDIQEETGMEVVIIRPPLVYGPNAPGNFGRLVRLVEKGWPLPLGAIHNKRSFVALDNLVDLIITCLDHPAAANQVFLAGDGEDLSTSDLLMKIGVAMGKPVRLLPVPENWLRFGAHLLGKKEVADRLLGSLQVDISKARDLLGWEPPISVEEGLKRCFPQERHN